MTVLAGRYQVLSLLKKGSMGAVYRAYDTLEDRQVALKQTVDPESDYLRAKFEAEARALEQLQHPNIPKILDFFMDPEGAFLVMELIDGENLDDELYRRRQPFAAEEVVRIALGVLEVLELLHHRQPPMVHRDIKPANLIRAAGGRIYLVDFGLVRDVSESTQTRVGTLGYCAQEQIQGHSEPRSDLFGLGATMAHLLTNKMPKPLTRPRLDGVPTLLADIVRTAMARYPDERFPDAATMAGFLQRLTD